MLEILFGISFSLFGGNIIDIQLKHHKYEKENYTEIFHLKDKESVNTYCVKHSRSENIQKKKYDSHNGREETKYKVTINCIKDNYMSKNNINPENYHKNRRELKTTLSKSDFIFIQSQKGMNNICQLKKICIWLNLDNKNTLSVKNQNKIKICLKSQFLQKNH